MFNIENNLQIAGLSQYLTTIDIECPDQRIAGQVLSIGAVTINIVDGTVASDFYARIIRDGQAELGLTELQSTIEWWDEIKHATPDGAYAWMEAFERYPRLRLPLALSALNAYLDCHYSKKEQAQVFGCGPEFDNVVLANAYRVTGVPMGWTFRGNQSIRTILLLSKIIFGTLPEHPAKGNIAHHALHDARREATSILRLLHHIGLHMEGI
jgi:hypothetical protein